jgi:hypothetical protein
MKAVPAAEAGNDEDAADNDADGDAGENGEAPLGDTDAEAPLDDPAPFPLEPEPTAAIPDTPEPAIGNVSEPAHVCVHCRLEPPDGSERASAYDGAFLHLRCEEAFIRARIAAEGIANEEPQPIHAISGGACPLPAFKPPSESPITPTGGNDYDGNGFDRGYPSGEARTGTPKAHYIYKHAKGLLYMRVTRTSGHTFPTQHWDKDGGRWAYGWPPTAIPYRLPELLAAPADVPVWICEGEKDADNVAALGLIATTNPGGAGKWQPELTQWFKGKQTVYILEDNDDAGRKHTTKVIAALRGVVPCIVPLSFSELPEKGDVSDWLEMGGNKKLLLARAEQAHMHHAARRKYTLIELHRLQLEATDWLWEGHLIRGELELIAGRPGVGKSQVQCQMIASISTGHPWPDGQKGPQPGSVILITAEDKAQDYHKRLTAAGADLTRVKVLKYVRRNNRDEMFLLGEDLDKLEQAIIDLGDVTARDRPFHWIPSVHCGRPNRPHLR